MHKIDGKNATEDGRFQEYDPATGQGATYITADWLNAVQAELIAILEAQGIEPSKASSAQVLAAMDGRFASQPALAATDGAALVGYQGGTVSDALADLAQGLLNGLSGGAPVYADTAAGLAATSEDGYFNVPSPEPNEIYIVYRHDPGPAATALGRTPSSAPVELLLETTVRGAPGKNKFNAAKAKDGTALSDTGAEFSASGRSVSEFIPVVEGVAYVCTATNKWAFYDGAKSFVSLFTGTTTTAPVDSEYVRIDILTSNKGETQFEQGFSPSPYEDYELVPRARSIYPDAYRERSIQFDAINTYQVAPENIEDADFLNYHDGTLVEGMAISMSDGVTITASGTTDHTNFIPVRPSTEYSAAPSQQAFFYRDDLSYISRTGDDTFTTPSDCRFVRFNLFYLASDQLQMNEGPTVSPEQQPHGYRLKRLHVDPESAVSITQRTARAYNLADAWYAWQNGDKFPIAMLGDSTTAGNGTTGYVARSAPYDFTIDYVTPNSYPAVLESIIHEATGFSNARIYNAGFSGQRATWALANIDEIMGYAYSDAKMIGISHGINDRTANISLFASNFYRDIEGLIIWCLENGYQPFLLTTQPTAIPSFTGTASGPDVETVANEIKRNLADKWGLELVDINKFARDFVTYSQYPMLDTIFEAPGNIIHFGDVGHKYEAELLFASICPAVMWVARDEQIDFANQFIESDVNWDETEQLATPVDGFKIQSKFTKGNSSDLLMQGVYVFNAARGTFSVTGYCADSVESAYISVNGADTSMDALVKTVASDLDMGLHRIQAFSGEVTAVNWRGMKIVF